jgi:hypothetical protein
MRYNGFNIKAILWFHLNLCIASNKGIQELKHPFYKLRIIIYQMRNNNSEVKVIKISDPDY